MLKPVLCGILMLSWAQFGANLFAQEDRIESLKRENELLKSEVEILKKHAEVLTQEVDRLKSLTRETTKSNTEQKTDEGSLIGIVWELDTLKPDGSVFLTVKFLAADGKVYFDSREVGTYNERGTRVRIDITKNVDARALGTAELLRVSNKPPMYQGRFSNKRGEKPIIRLRAVID
ncbi:MAG: hypothetical protein NTU79_20935 [Planctomycetota bacterium]|nr:hypothetical protein [Planctomycetota bacterium]